MILRSVSWALLLAPFTLACSADDTDVPGNPQGTGGFGDGECPSNGRGTLVVEVLGLPAEVEPDIGISGPDAPGSGEPGTFEDLIAGTYTVLAARVGDFDPIVRTVYEPSITSATACVQDDSEVTVTIEYAPIPTSNKLWMASGADAELVAFSSFDLSETAALDATVAIDGPGGKEVAFDQNGNLWALGPTATDPMLVRFDAAELGESAELVPTFAVNVPEIPCLPAIRSMAFDADGNLWLSACGEQVLRIAAADLTSGQVTADVVFSGFVDNQGIAFDADGNLWVADEGFMTRYDASRLDESDSGPSDRNLAVSDAFETDVLAADKLAFDQAGNLWAADFGSNYIFMVGAPTLEGSGVEDVVADVSIAVDPDALLYGLTFDESNGLWITLDSERFGKLTAAQLGESSGPGAPTAPEVIIQSSSIGNAGGLAFFPAPAGLPLYHALP